MRDHNDPDHHGSHYSTSDAPMVATLPPRRAMRGILGWLLIAFSVSLASLLVILVGLVQSQAITWPFGSNQANVHVLPATPTLGPTVIPTTTPLPQPSAEQVRNARAGCANGVVKPMSQILWTGENPLLTTPQPAPHEVALTFDDGPTPYSTPAILDALELSHTPATFFVEGSYAAIWPQLVQREWQDGFAIGMHTWDHPNMMLQSAAGLAHQFGDTLAAVRKALGTKACLWMWRPPYGSYNMHVVNTGSSYGLTTVTWDTDSFDWTTPGTDAIVARVLRAAHPGAIILMHDGPANRAETAQALPLILAGLKARGLTPVTLPQLLVDGHYPGLATTPTAPNIPTPSTHPMVSNLPSRWLTTGGG